MSIPFNKLPFTHSSTTSSSTARHRRLVIRHDDSNEDDEDFDDFSDIEPELVQLNHRGRGLSDTGKHYKVEVF